MGVAEQAASMIGGGGEGGRPGGGGRSGGGAYGGGGPGGGAGGAEGGGGSGGGEGGGGEGGGAGDAAKHVLSKPQRVVRLDAYSSHVATFANCANVVALAITHAPVALAANVGVYCDGAFLAALAHDESHASTEA